MGVTTAIASVAGTAISAGKALSGGGGGGGNSEEEAKMEASEQRALDFRQKAADLYNDLEMPVQDKTPKSFYSWLQDYVPETYSAYEAPMAQMSDSPETRAAQMAALEQWQGYAKGGLNATDQTMLDQIQRKEAAAASATGAAATDSLRNRGLGGSGAEYAARLQGNQSAADQTNSLYSDAMKSAFERQLKALDASGTLAGNIRNTDTTISKSMADITNNFNKQIMDMRERSSKYAADTRNAAQTANLTGRQGIENQNVGVRNSELDRQNQIRQQDFANIMSKISGQSNAYNAQATDAYAQQAAAAQRQLGNDQQSTAALNGLVSAGKSIGSLFGGSGSSATGGSWRDSSPLASSLFPSSSSSASTPDAGVAWDLPDNYDFSQSALT